MAGRGSESFLDIRGNEDFMAGYNVSFVSVFRVVYLFCFRLVILKPRETVVHASLETSMQGPLSIMAGRFINGVGMSLRAAGMKKATRFTDAASFNGF